MVSAKREVIIFLLKSLVVCMTRVLSSSSIGVQSENHVFMAVGVSCWDRIRIISSHMSFMEFI